MILAAVLMLAESSRAGTVTVGGGTLELSGSLAADQVLVATGATLAGSGAIDGSLDLAGTISPGTSGATIGVISISQELTCRAGSIFVCDMTSHIDGDSLLADTASGNCTVSVQQTEGAIPIDLAIIRGSAGTDYAGFAMAEAQAGAWSLSPTNGDLRLTDLTGDSDGDHLNDWWELAYFGGRTNAVSGADPDGDGADNHNEHMAGTAPDNPASRFAIASLTPDNGAIVVTWSSSEGHLYDVIRSTSLFGTFLPIASNIAAAPPYNTYRDEDTEHATHYYYRIKLD